MSDFRVQSVAHFGLAMLDILVLPFAIISLVMPTRYLHTIKACNKAYKQATNGYEDFEYVFEVRLVLFTNAWIGVLDLFCLTIGIISMVIPTRFLAFWRILFSDFGNFWDDDYKELRSKLVCNLIYGILDILVIPQGILSIFIPTRIYHFFKQCNKIHSDNSRYDYAFDDKEYFSYNFDYRWLCFYNLWLGVADIFCFIVGILSIIIFPTRFMSFYRAMSIFWSDYKIDSYGIYRYFLISNFFFALLDLITFLHCLLLFPIVLIRYFNLKKADYIKYGITFTADTGRGTYQPKIEYNPYFRLWIIGNIYKGIIDVIFIPLLIVDMVSIYNGIEIYHLINDRNDWTTNKMNDIRIKIVINFFILLFDIIFMVPLLLFIVITMYRIPNVCRQWRAVWKNYYMRRGPNAAAANLLPEHDMTRLFICEQFISIFADIPCLIMIIFVFLTVFRAKRLYNKLTDGNISANRRRLHCLYQTVFVLRDLFFLIPFLIMIGTLFRAPILILELMTKLNKPRIDNNDPIHWKLYQCILEFPLKGKPLLHIKAKKESDFTFNEGKCKVFVLGNRLWNAISSVFGSSMSTMGQSMLPNKLWNDHGMNYSDIANNNTQRIQTTIELQTPLIERSTVLYNTQKLNQNIEFIMQIEHETRGILFILVLKMSDFITCAQSDTGKYQLPNECFANLDQNKVNEIRGTEFMGLIESFYIIVGMQFMKWINDMIHLILFLLLLLIPWRWIKCVKKLFKTKYEYAARENEKAIGRLEYLIIIWNKLWVKLFEPMLNDIVKTESNSNHSSDHFNYGFYNWKSKDFDNINCSPIYERWARNIERDWIQYQNNYLTEDKICMKLTTYDRIAKNIDSKLSAVSPVPVTKELIFDFLDLENILLYLKIMQSSINILAMKETLKWEDYAIISEQLQVKIDSYQNQMVSLHNIIHTTHNEIEYEAKEKSKHVKCAIFKKSLSLNYKIIHDSLRKGLVDISILLPFIIIAIGLIIYYPLDYHKIWPMIAVVVIILLLTMHRIIPLIIATYNLTKLRKRMKKENPNRVLIVTRFGFRQILDFQLKELGNDIKLLLLFTLFSLIIIITLVRIFEYISTLINYQRIYGKKLCLRYAVDVAKDEIGEIWRNIIDLFNFIFMWKTYKFFISSLIFGLFLPSAGFLEIFVVLFPRIPRKIRQIFSIILWFGLLSVIIYFSVSIDTNTTYYYTFCLITIGIVILFYFALFIVGKYDTNSDMFDTHIEKRDALLRDNYDYYNVEEKTIDIETGSKAKQGSNPKVMLWSFPTDEYIGEYIRFSWPNVLAIFGLIFDTFQLISILFYVFHISNNSKFNIPSDDNIFENLVKMSEYVLLMNIKEYTFNILSVIFIIIGFLWLVIISLPLVVEELFHFEANDTFIHSPIWVRATWIYSKIFFVFLLINWVKLFQCTNTENNECIVISSDNSYEFGTVSILSLIITIYSVITSLIILVYKNIKIRYSKTDNLDIKYPLSFIQCLQIFQSLFIISGMLIILKNDNTENAFLICCILSIVMLLWHIIYPFVSKTVIGTNKDTIYYNFSSIKHFVCIQIMFYFIVAYIAIILYLYVINIVENNIGAIILYGTISIAFIGILISIIVNRTIHHNRIKKLHESELQTVLDSLSNLYEKTSINNAVGDWFRIIGKYKLSSFTKNNYSSPNDLKYLLIEFEKNILFERLTKDFVLNKRDLWKQNVLITKTFNDFIPLINELCEAIISPPYFTLCIQTLSGECDLFIDAPKDICFLIMQFAIDCKSIIEIANETILHSNSFPKYDINDNIIQRITIFSQQCDTQLQLFVDSIKQMKKQLKRRN